MRTALLALAVLLCGPRSGVSAQEGSSEALPLFPSAAMSTSAPEGASARPAAGGKKPRAGRRSADGRPLRPARKKTPYDVLKESWHAPAPADMCMAMRTAPVPDLVFRIQGKNTTYTLKPSSRQGGFDETQLAIAKEAFGSWKGGPTPHPRTLDLIYAATLHFEVPYVHLISGIRKDRGGSRHSHGLAADVVFPGVTDDELAAYFRAQGFVGVGTYPRSGFVHVDTRDKSYFWIDYSSPNKRSRTVQVRAEEARQVDEEALARGSDGFVNPPRLQRALQVRAARKRRAAIQQQERLAARAQKSSAQPQP